MKSHATFGRPSDVCAKAIFGTRQTSILARLKQAVCHVSLLDTRVLPFQTKQEQGLSPIKSARQTSTSDTRLLWAGGGC